MSLVYKIIYQKHLAAKGPNIPRSRFLLKNVAFYKKGTRSADKAYKREKVAFNNDSRGCSVASLLTTEGK
jgi:hypothetical protein